MVVTGDITSSSGLTIQGGAVYGTGTLPTTTVNDGGTLAPGLPGTPGTINIHGNLLMAAGATYLVQAGTGHRRQRQHQRHRRAQWCDDRIVRRRHLSRRNL